MKAGGGKRVGAFAARMLIAHLVAYPIGVVWCVGAMPFSFPVLDHEITRATGDVVLWGLAPMPAYAAVVVRATILVGAIAFVLEHIVGAASSRIGDPAQSRRAFLAGSIALAAAGALAAFGGWLWFLIHYG